MMGKIYLTSDLHFCHDKDFLYKPRGFNSVEEMNEKILKNHNSVVNDEDDVYILGDLMLNDKEKGLNYISNLNGKLHIICGNHDTLSKIELYSALDNIIDIQYAYLFKYQKYTFFLCHYPVYMGNYDLQMSKEWCLHGHTHSLDKFSEIDKNYNVALDAHNCYPVNIDTIVEDIRNKWNKVYQEKNLTK